MNLIDTLYLLKQIYTPANQYYDREQGLLLHKIPAHIPQEELDALKAEGHLPNQVAILSHDEIMEEFFRLAGTWTLKEAADAFLAGLWSEPFLWQNALTAKVMSMVMPMHEHTPYSSHSADVCGICGYHKHAVDVTNEWYRAMNSGTALDGEPVGQVIALRAMEQMGKRPAPNTYDLWTFRAILTVIRSMPPKTRYSKVRDALKKEKLLPTSDKYIYGGLLEALALMGILDTQDYPGMVAEFTTYKKRDERPSRGSEAQAPLAWWNTSIGINEENLKKLFPDRDWPSVDLENRPMQEPPLAQTIKGQLDRKRLPKKLVPC